LVRTGWAMMELVRDLARLDSSAPEVLVEVASGMVREVKMLNASAIPVKVVVRDFDSLKLEPDNYQDDEWLLGESESDA